MNRREFLRCASLASLGLTVPGTRQLLFAESAAGLPSWRTFEVTTRVTVLKPSGTTRIWLPTGLAGKTPFQRTLSNHFVVQGGRARLAKQEKDAMGIVVAEFPSGVQPEITLTSRVMTRDIAVSWNSPAKTVSENSATLQYFLRPTKLLPTDGIVREKAVEITRGTTTDVDKARAIYEWIVVNTFRDPKTRGCGVGDVRFMLESGDLGGKCADLNALFVALARAAAIPARDVYGLRVAKSQLGYKSLGASSENVTKAQHCRAEVYLTGFGWVPVDPADVRKVVLEEPPGNRSLDDDLVKSARARLFGSWEMNWMAYNYAHDVILPDSKGEPVGFLMYPEAETVGGRLDCLDPDSFKYEITSREITPATVS